MAKFDIAETHNEFYEGVEYTTEQHWVDPEDIEDQELSRLYEEVCAAYSNYKDTASKFDSLLNKKYEDEA
jgi:hypothetical protein